MADEPGENDSRKKAQNILTGKFPDGRTVSEAMADIQKGLPTSEHINSTLAKLSNPGTGLAASLNNSQSAVEAAKRELAKEIDSLNEKVAGYENKVSVLTGEIRGIESDLDKFRSSVDQPAEQLETFKEAIIERLKLQEARKLWVGNAVAAKKAYRISWVILIFLLVLVPAFAILQSSAIFTFFRAIGQAVLVDLPENASETAILIAAVSRLVLVTLPVVMYVWLIRIVVRFNMRSLLLMDDANQRNTMLETYLHLVEQDADVKADRPLILEALFRRTPGHGPETIEPPNLTDIMNVGARLGMPGK